MELKMTRRELEKVFGDTDLLSAYLDGPQTIEDAEMYYEMFRGTKFATEALVVWRALWSERHLEGELYARSIETLYLTIQNAPPGDDLVVKLRNRWFEYHATWLEKKYGTPKTFTEAIQLFDGVSPNKKYLLIKLMIELASEGQSLEIISKYEFYMDPYLMGLFFQKFLAA